LCDNENFDCNCKAAQLVMMYTLIMQCSMPNAEFMFHEMQGVAGPFWYAAGATIQILLFGVLAVEIKRKAPSAHTVLEIVKARWGCTAHKVPTLHNCIPIVTARYSPSH